MKNSFLKYYFCPPSLGELCTAANHVSTIVELNVIGGVASINWSGVKGVAPEPPPGSGAAKGTAFSMVLSSLVLFNFGRHFDGQTGIKISKDV